MSDIVPAVNWVGGLIGAATDKRVAGIEKRERADPLLAAHFRENFELEFALAAARNYCRSTGRLPKGKDYDSLYSFLIPAQRIHAALPAVAKTPYEGRLRDAVKEVAEQCSGARPALIALHLVDPLSRDYLQSMLRMPNGIHTITNTVFRNENRWHVDSIAFTVPQVRRTDQSGARWLSGDLVMLNNPQPRFVCPELRSIFRDAA
jgi:hypothetical protein